MNAHLRCLLRPASPLILTIVSLQGLAVYGLDYSFTTIVDNQGPFTSVNVNSTQPLNDAGEVAFYGDHTVSSFDGFYKSDGTTLTPIGTYSQFFIDSSYTGSINEAGRVVIRGDSNAFQGGLYSGTGGSLTVELYEGDLPPNPRWLITGAATINDSGKLAFYGGRSGFPDQAPEGSVYGHYIVTAGMVTTMAEEDEVFSGTASVAPALNDAGQAAFMMRARADGKFQVIRYDAPSLTTIASGFVGAQKLSINNSGQIAFVSAGSTAVQVYSNGTIETVASTEDGFSRFLQGEQAINDAGDVVFSASVDEYQGNPVAWNGVFSGPDVVNDRVLLDGDSLYDRVVTSVNLLGFNDANQILMMVELAGPDEWRGLVLATPMPTGDFDDDGDVDGSDFLVWQRNPAIGDLADWQAEYGNALIAPPQSIPEPNQFTLVALACFSLVVLRASRSLRSPGSMPSTRCS